MRPHTRVYAQSITSPNLPNKGGYLMVQGEACLAPTTDWVFRVGAQHAAPTPVLRTNP